MCLPAAIIPAVSLGLSAVGTGVAVASAYNQSKGAREMADYNAKVAEMQAQDSTRQGDEEAARVRRQGAQLAGAQRAGFSAKGIDFGEGSAGDALDQTDFFSQMDQATVKTNAARAAWNARAQRNGYAYEARAQQPGWAAAGTLLAGASNVASKWYSYSKGP